MVQTELRSMTSDASRRRTTMRGWWSLRACALVFLLLALCSSGFVAALRQKNYRVSEERQRQLQEEKGRVHCSRSRSRTVRAIVSEYLMPFVESQKYTLPKNCPLHPGNDIFREQEENVDELRPMQWQCRYCKKVFRSREFLDMHFDNRHSEKLDTNSSRCLADACRALHCDYFDSLSSESKTQTATCKPAVAERNRHACEVLATTCFPAEQNHVAQRLNDFFKRQFCDAHTCKKKLKIYPRGSGINRNRSLFLALSLFVLVVLAIFYLVIFLHKRESSLLMKGLRRASSRHAYKARKN